MSVVLAGLRELARTLGCGAHQAEDAVREERSARAALSRRGFFLAAGAVAAGVCMPLPLREPGRWVIYVARWQDLKITFDDGQVFVLPTGASVRLSTGGYWITASREPA